MSNSTVVIVGAGFAGITAARALRGAPVQTVVVDRNNFHLFTPLLYEVATSLLDPSQIAQPVRAMIRSLPNAEFRLGQVTSIDLSGKRVMTDRGSIAYDYLLLATGSVASYFGNHALEASTGGLKDLDQALALRNRMLRQFERARWTDNEIRRRAMLTFVVVGGGPTGIEYAGALSDLTHLVLKQDFRGQLNMREVRIILIEASEHLLGAYKPWLQQAARDSLERKDVTVMPGARVEAVEGDLVRLSDGETIEAGTVIWTAGVQANPLAEGIEAERGRGGTLRVEPTLQLPGHPEIFVAGDLASVVEDGRQLPQLAPVAIQGGERAARNIQALVTGRPLKPFRYFDRGIMATIGRNAAVVQSGPLQLSGFIGWVAWLFLHLLLIVSLRSRLMVFINWTWTYLFYDRPVRIILESKRYPGEDPDRHVPEKSLLSRRRQPARRNS